MSFLLQKDLKKCFKKIIFIQRPAMGELGLTGLRV
jgi:hypothetical protein